jgi:hypothetical protein
MLIGMIDVIDMIEQGVVSKLPFKVQKGSGSCGICCPILKQETAMDSFDERPSHYAANNRVVGLGRLVAPGDQVCREDSWIGGADISFE